MHVPQHALGWARICSTGQIRERKRSLLIPDTFSRRTTKYNLCCRRCSSSYALCLVRCVGCTSFFSPYSIRSTLYACTVLCRLTLSRKTLLRPIICLYMYGMWFIGLWPVSPIYRSVDRYEMYLGAWFLLTILMYFNIGYNTPKYSLCFNL